MGSSNNMLKVGIIGSGQWSLALSKVLKNVNILIKARKIEKAKKIFNGTDKISLTESFLDLSKCDLIFLANPSQTVRENLDKLKSESKEINSKFIICCKGVEKDSNKLISQVVEEFFPKNHLAVLSGPNFSSEVISGLPTASVFSSNNKKLFELISNIISQDKFRIYFNTDLIGTQIGGAMKNIIAIACGFIIGKNLGNNAKASIITRGLSEIVELGLKMGASKNTFYGLSGIGDLTLTCSSLKSRNTKLGYNLAKKKHINASNQVLEGMESCESICDLGKIHNVELPICNSVRKIIRGYEFETIIHSLLSRPLQYET